LLILKNFLEGDILTVSPFFVPKCL